MATNNDAVTPTQEGKLTCHSERSTTQASSDSRQPKGASTNLYVVESGIAIFNFRGTGSEWLRDQLVIPTNTIMRRPAGTTRDPFFIPGPRVVATAALASISNNNEAVDAGWAVDACWSDQDAYGRIILHVNLSSATATVSSIGWPTR